MIFIAIGSNQPGGFASSLALCEAAVSALESEGVRIAACSRWYRSAPLPPDPAQPWFVNGVASVTTALEPRPLLALLNRLEAEFGRVRGERNGPRTLDLDLIAHGCRLIESPDLILPHPRMHERGFVLRPMMDIDPNWRHPRTGENIGEMLAALPEGQLVMPME